MSASLRFLLAELALAALGGGIAFHPSVRAMSYASRFTISLCAGAVALTLEATVYSLNGIAWTLPGLSVPLVLLSAACAAWWRRRPCEPRRPPVLRRTVLIWSSVAVAAALLFLALSLALSAATSMDYLLFWGVKAVRFASHRGIDVEFLRDQFSIHAVPEYPPLVPIVEAWGCLAAGRMPWRTVPGLSLLWIVAAIPILFDRCRRRMSDEAAAALVACWTAALSVSLAYSMSGGNAEAPLLCFESIAVAWLLTERAGESRLVPVLALCAAALTKVEGLAAVFFLAVGAAIGSEERPRWKSAARSLALAGWPVAAAGVWFFYQTSIGMPAGYRSHGELLRLYPDNLPRILQALVDSLNGGSFWLPWALAVVLLVRHASAWRRAAPALALACGLLLFFVFDYLHDKDDPAERIGWTAPRVTQSALSAAILAAGVLSLGAARPREQEGETP